MVILFPLAIVVVLGALAWGVVGVLRQRSAEPFTIATATTFYAHLLTIVGVLMALTGTANVVKAVLGYLDPGFSYGQAFQGAPGGGPGGPPADYLQQQRDQDLVLGITLLVIGIIVAAGHLALARAVRTLQGGAPLWVTRGTLVALTLICALAGILGSAAAVYQGLNYFLVHAVNGTRQPFGDSVGIAVAFVPAWVVAMSRLLRVTRGGDQPRAVTAAPVEWPTQG